MTDRPDLLDLDALLVPIPPHGVGKNLVFDPHDRVFDQINAARKVEAAVNPPSQEFAAHRKEAKEADWKQVRDLATVALGSKTKDLRIAASLVEAIAHLHRLDGLAAGFTLLVELQERFWDHVFPEIEDEDLDDRATAYVTIAKTLPPLIDSWTPDQDKLDRASIDAGRESLVGCRSAFEGWRQSVQLRFGPIVRGLGEIAGALGRLDEAYRSASPAPVEEPEPEPEPEPPAVIEPEPIAESFDPVPDQAQAVAVAVVNEAVVEPVADEPVEVAPLSRSTSPLTRWRPIEDAGDARRAVLSAAETLRSLDPADPTPYLLIRSLGLGEACRTHSGTDAGSWPGPTREARLELRRLVAARDWEPAAESAERALAATESQGWVDAHRHAVEALESSGRDLAAKACFGMLELLLEMFPELVHAELDDGTPAASAATLRWLAGRAQAVDDSTGKTSVDVEAVEAPTAQAHRLARAGRLLDAIELLDQTRSTATDGRGRFLAQLELAEFASEHGQASLSFALLDDLERTIDAGGLETWEGKAWCLRPLEALRSVLVKSAEVWPDAADRLRRLELRMARLDPRRAVVDGNR